MCGIVAAVVNIAPCLKQAVCTVLQMLLSTHKCVNIEAVKQPPVERVTSGRELKSGQVYSAVYVCHGPFFGLVLHCCLPRDPGQRVYKEVRLRTKWPTGMNQGKHGQQSVIAQKLARELDLTRIQAGQPLMTHFHASSLNPCKHSGHAGTVCEEAAELSVPYTHKLSRHHLGSSLITAPGPPSPPNSNGSRQTHCSALPARWRCQGAPW